MIAPSRRERLTFAAAAESAIQRFMPPLARPKVGAVAGLEWTDLALSDDCRLSTIVAPLAPPGAWRRTPARDVSLQNAARRPIFRFDELRDFRMPAGIRCADARA